MLLAQHLTGPLLRIETSDDRFFLYSSEFESMSDPAAVEEYAANQLTLVGGAMFVESPDYRASVEVVTALQHGVERPLPIVITPDPAELILTTFRPTVLVGGVAVPEVNIVERRVMAGQSNPAVAEAFLIWITLKLAGPISTRSLRLSDETAVARRSSLNATGRQRQKSTALRKRQITIGMPKIPNIILCQPNQ
jgi:hypothetical protein